MDLHKRNKSRARPATSLRGAKGSVRDGKLQYALLVVALCVIYYIGYRNGQSMSALSSYSKSQPPSRQVQTEAREDDTRTELDELGLSQNTRVAMGLTVLQNAQVNVVLLELFGLFVCQVGTKRKGRGGEGRVVLLCMEFCEVCSYGQWFERQI